MGALHAENYQSLCFAEIFVISKHQGRNHPYLPIGNGHGPFLKKGTNFLQIHSDFYNTSASRLSPVLLHSWS